MNLIDAEAAERLYAIMGAGIEHRVGRRGTPSLASRRWAAGRRTSARWPTTSSARCSRTISTRSASPTTRTPLEDGLPTARSLIFVTPDAQRTMQTFLGACTQLGPEDVNMDYITSSKVVYLEGYLWDLPRAKEAMRDAAVKAQASGVKVSLTLVRLVLRRPLPRRVPRARGQARRHPVRQRDRDPVALPGRRRSTRRCSTCAGTARSRR